MQHYHSNGKLLLFGEYFVLEGAKSLAIPTQLGQSLSVTAQTSLLKGLSWKSFDHENILWFEAYFDEHLDIKHCSDDAIARTLQTILFVAKQLNKKFIDDAFYYDIETRLQFPKEWGLGSSSTLIANIAQWAQVDAFDLFFNSFKGSGYDIACALNNLPITYELKDEKPVWAEVDFKPPFIENIAFVYLDKKQNSREGIQHFKQKSSLWYKELELTSAITKKALSCQSINTFMDLIDEHEAIVAQALELKPVKELLFQGFKGSIKSLGAWGGDFVMVASVLPFSDIKNYFNQKGYTTIIPYIEMIRR